MMSTTASGIGDYYLGSNKSVTSGDIGQKSVVQLQYYIPEDEPIRELGKYEAPAMGMIPPYAQTRVRTFQSLISQGDLNATAARQTRYLSTNHSYSVKNRGNNVTEDQSERRKRSCRICGSAMGSNANDNKQKHQKSPKHEQHRHRSHRRQSGHPRKITRQGLTTNDVATRSGGSTRVGHRRNTNRNGGSPATMTNGRFRSCSCSSASYYTAAANHNDQQDWVLVLGKEINRYSLTDRERKALIRDLKGVQVEKRNRITTSTAHPVHPIANDDRMKSRASSIIGPTSMQNILPYNSLPALEPSQQPPARLESRYDESIANKALVPYNNEEHFSPYLPTKIAPAEYVVVSPMSRMTSHTNTNTLPPPPSIVARSTLPANPLISCTAVENQPQRIPSQQIFSRSTSVIAADNMIRHRVPVELSTHPVGQSKGFGGAESTHRYYYYCPDLPATKLNPFPAKQFIR